MTLRSVAHSSRAWWLNRPRALTFWPGDVILTESSDSAANNGGEPRLYTDIVGQNGATGGYVNSYGANVPTVFAQQCSVPGSWSSIWMSCPAGDSVSNNFKPIGALLLQSGTEVSDGTQGGLKRRLNFLNPGPALPATHLITLGDSNAAKTLATPGHRPSNDPYDTWIGLDNANTDPTNFQLAFGAPVSISNYIGRAHNPGAPLEVLNATTKTFNVPIASGVAQGTAPLQIASSTPVGTLTVSNHPTTHNCGAGSTCSINPTTNGQIVFGTITLPNNASTVTLSGISPAFTSMTSFNCVANDVTIQANPVKAVPASSSSVAFTGIAETTGDMISYQCVGN